MIYLEALQHNLKQMETEGVWCVRAPPGPHRAGRTELRDEAVWLVKCWGDGGVWPPGAAGNCGGESKKTGSHRRGSPKSECELPSIPGDTGWGDLKVFGGKSQLDEPGEVPATARPRGARTRSSRPVWSWSSSVLSRNPRKVTAKESGLSEDFP